MKTTRSAFSGFPRDRVHDAARDRRPAHGHASSPRSGATARPASTSTRRTTRSGRRCSRSSPTTTARRVQTSIWIMAQGDARAARRGRRGADGAAEPPPLAGRHRRRSASTTTGGIYVATTEPHGLIEATVRRGDADDRPAASRCADRPSRAHDRILTDEALAFVADLQRRFGPVRLDLLRRREERQAEIDAGVLPDFLAATARGPRVRLDRRAGAGRPRRPAGRDHRPGRAEDDDQRPQLRARRCSWPTSRTRSRRPGPTWSAARPRSPTRPAGTLTFDSPEGKAYRLAPAASGRRSSSGRAAGTSSSRTCWSTARRSRPRCSTSGCTCSTRARRRSRPGAARTSTSPSSSRTTRRASGTTSSSTPRRRSGSRAGRIRATVLIETILAAFEMDEILYELREHAAGSTPVAGTTCSAPSRSSGPTRASRSPDRAQLTMTVPFMRAYTELLVQTCHRRGAHAIGGMAAFIPNRRDPEVTERALARVRDDKVRESGDGFDGTWVAHPDLVPVAMEVFDGVLGDRPEPEGPDPRRGGGRRRRSCWTSASPAARSPRPASGRTSGWRSRTSTRGCAASGAAAIDNLMEDAATAEISRSQLWLWITQAVVLDDGDGRSRPSATRRSATRSWHGSAGRGRAASPRPPTCSIASSSTTTSPSSSPSGRTPSSNDRDRLTRSADGRIYRLSIYRPS